MTISEKCSQLFVALGNAETDEGLKHLISGRGIGGVLFRPAPLDTVKEQFEEAGRHARIPLLKAANLEEGGAGVLSDGTYYGSELMTAAADDPEWAGSLARCCALEGRMAGVNWTFSPVVDIDLNYLNPITNVRTFGSDTGKILSCARSYVSEIQKYGIAASCKHYPGDGVDYRDQHLHPTINSLSADEWYDSFGRIYSTLIDDGLMSIMAGHIVQPAVIQDINPDAGPEDMLPGSQSQEMLTGVLRDKYGFNGLIITDATIMGGYTMTMKRSDAIPKSIMAGADMLCFGTDINEDIDWLIEAYNDGRLTQERLDEAVTRVLALKAVLNRDYPLPDIDCLAESEACAGRAATLVKNDQDVLPVSSSAYPDVRLMIVGSDNTTDGSLAGMISEELESRGFSVERYDPMEDDLHGTREIPSGRLTLLVLNYPAASNQTTVRVSWCSKHALEIPRFLNEEPFIAVSFANPYHLQDIPRVRTYINAYAATRATVRAVIARLTGEEEFTGVSPVDPFCGLPDTR